MLCSSDASRPVHLATMSTITSQLLLTTDTLSLRDVHCSGTCRHRSAEECASSTQLVFPYRGLYLRHVASDQTVADANHVLFFNGEQAYQVSHPLDGGDACLSLHLSHALLAELTPGALIHGEDDLRFRSQSLRIDARAQALVALLDLHIDRAERVGHQAELGLALVVDAWHLGDALDHVLHPLRATGADHRPV